ncbi:phosphodiester glycosidase family protein [Longimycelium tulufanense]|nr:phosphodiester glycosidase family protein [Longimycelium tulufanense]
MGSGHAETREEQVRARSVSVLLVLAVVALLVTPMRVASAPIPLGPPPVESLPEASPGERATVLTAPAGVGAAVFDEGLETAHAESPVAPGLTLREFDRFDARGWIRGDVLMVDLDQPALTTRYLNPGVVADRKPLSQQAAEAGVVAGVNGDFFDILATSAPEGIGVSAGRILHGARSGHNTVVAFDARRRVGRLAEAFLEGTITLPDNEKIAVSNLNSPRVAENGVGIYTPLWGSASRRTVVVGAGAVTEVEVHSGKVEAVRDGPRDGPVPFGSVLLLARDAVAGYLSELRHGDSVDVRYRLRARNDIDVALGGMQVLVRDGEVNQLDDTAMHPRTAVGFSADGSRMFMVTVDGRQRDSRGMTLLELARLMRSLGAVNALNLDGGGSSTLLARRTGESAAAVRNAPSEGEERPVPNGLGVDTALGSGKLLGFRVAPTVVSEHSDRVLTGLTRRLTAYGHDEMGAPVVSSPHWYVVPNSGGKAVATRETAVFHAEQHGTARVHVKQGLVSGETELAVLGTLSRAEASPQRVALSGPGVTSRFQVFGQDSEGFGTWIEPTDVTLDYDETLVRVSPDRDGFEVVALKATGSTTVTVRVGDVTSRLAITVGTRDRSLSTMDDLERWQVRVYPAVVGAHVSLGRGHDDGKALVLDYRLTGTRVARAAYLSAEPPIPLPAGTQRVGLWVNGDGKGAWLRLTMVDSTNTAATVDLARHVDWTGWRFLDAAVPSALVGAVRLERLYVVEPDGNRQYEGRIALDELTAKVAPPTDLPPAPPHRDPAVVTQGELPPVPGALRVAVVSDAQFTADNPQGPLVQQARRTLREALAANPDVVLINGDLVDRGTNADFVLARRILDEELGDQVRWYYLPGNHETYGPGDTSEFRKVFGETYRVVDLAGFRMVLLDSALGSLRAGGFDQIRELRAALRGVVENPAVRGVLVAMHHPTHDPGPTGQSALSDSKEARLVERWLAEVRASGKPAVLATAHAGLFHASRVDGVSRLVNGNAGKSPSVAANKGGFTGWTLVRLDPTTGVRAEMRPHVDQLELDVPERMRVGEVRPVRADVVQAGRRVPVAYPVNATWSGSPGLHVGPPAAAGPHHVAAFDLETGHLVALRPGKAEVRVTVNGVRRSAPATIQF